MKSLIVISLLVLTTACGKGGGAGTRGERSSNNVQVKCEIEVLRSDLTEIAASADKARRNCNFSEEEAVRFVM